MPLRAFNPVSSFRWARGMTIVAALMTVFFIMQLVGQVPAALWVIFGEDRFRWSATMIGLSLAVFGILHALAQAFVTGPATKRFGEKQAIIAGMAADALGYVLLAFDLDAFARYRARIHWPSFYNVVTGKTLALPNLIALQHIPLSPAGVIAKRPSPIALPNSCAA